MSVPKPLRGPGCTGVVIIGGCVPPADVIVLPTDGGGSSWSPVDESRLPASPGESFVAESSRPAAAALGVVVGPSGPVTSLHTSPHHDLVPTKYPVFPDSGDLTPSRYGPGGPLEPTRYGPGGMLGGRVGEAGFGESRMLDRKLRGLA